VAASGNEGMKSGSRLPVWPMHHAVQNSTSSMSGHERNQRPEFAAVQHGKGMKGHLPI
jgi:hypothetical protein